MADRPMERVQSAETISANAVAGEVEDGPADQARSTRRGKLRFGFAFATISLVAFTSALDAQILAIALPVRTASRSAIAYFLDQAR